VVTGATPALPSVVVETLGGAMFTTARSMLSQHTARRNALVASTALAQQRQEWLEVERFLEEHARRRTASAGTARTALRA
jgi:hypothetical protein